MTARSESKVFYGWIVVAAAFVCLFISVGFLFYSYAVFLPVLSEEFDGHRFGPSLCLAVMNASVGLFAPFLGRALERGGIRKYMTLGAISMGVGFVLLSQISAVWQMFFIFATFLGVGASMVGQLPSSTLVSNWFAQKRGMALGIATMGISLSGVVMVPITSMMIEAMGWRNTFLAFGGVAFIVVLPVVRLLVVGRPEDMGLQPDALYTQDESRLPESPSDTVLWRTRDSLRNRDFWVMTMLIAFNFFCMSGTLIHMPAYGRDLGFTLGQAGFALSTGAAVGVFGKVVFGYIADRMDTRFAMFLAMAFQALAVFLLPGVASYPALLAVGGLFGLGMGGIVPLWGSFVGEYFGRMSFGRIMGLMSPFMVPVQVSGVPFAGFMFDRTQSYTTVFRVYLGVYICTAFLLLLLNKPSRRHG